MPRRTQPRHGPAPAPEGRGDDASRRASALTVAILVVLPLLGTALALAGGPWQVVVPLLYAAALGTWLLVWRGSLRELLVPNSLGSTWRPFCAGAVVYGLGSALLWTADGGWARWSTLDAARLLPAVAAAVLVGCLMTALPEELALRRCFLEPLRTWLGGTAAVGLTAAAFTAMHLPTWIASGATARVYAAEVPDKLVFGLVAGWSVLRLGSLSLALGMHVGGNLVGVLLDSLVDPSAGAPSQASTGWGELTWSVGATVLAEAALAGAVVVALSRRAPERAAPHAPEPGSQGTAQTRR